MEKPHKENRDLRLALRWAAGAISSIGLASVFIFQRFDWATWLGIKTQTDIATFLINRSFRFVLNDLLGVLLVFAFFGKKKFVIISVYVQALGFLFVLLPYLLIKWNYPAYNGPLISFLHRLILNPLLIYLLIFFFWYQEKNKSSIS
jgi:exosortase F-associated protein